MPRLCNHHDQVFDFHAWAPSSHRQLHEQFESVGSQILSRTKRGKLQWIQQVKGRKGSKQWAPLRFSWEQAPKFIPPSSRAGAASKMVWGTRAKPLAWRAKKQWQRFHLNPVFLWCEVMSSCLLLLYVPWFRLFFFFKARVGFFFLFKWRVGLFYGNVTFPENVF